MPLLCVKEVAGLRLVSKALMMLVKEWPMRLVKICWWQRGVGDLAAALTCFPAAESLEIEWDDARAPADGSIVRSLLRAHGGTLRRVVMPRARHLLTSAVQAGALPNLRFLEMDPGDPVHREILARGMLQLLEEMEVNFWHEEHPAALEPLRCLPRLRRLKLETYGLLEEAAFPPFIPPSLKALSLKVLSVAPFESLLRELPSMLQSSGARLEEIEAVIPGDLSDLGGAALAQVVRACSSTLRTVKLMGPSNFLSPARTRELLPCLMSCCDTLEVLHCPWSIFSALPATCPSFPHLTDLLVYDGSTKKANMASPAWDIMAGGRLPVLATLSIRASHLVEGGGGDARLPSCLEAVAGTLKRLTLIGRRGNLESQDLPTGVAYELGVAIGKLRRLRYLELKLFDDGRAYHALGRGMADSGGCPELFEVNVAAVSKHFLSLTYEPSLIVPSVRDLQLDGSLTEDEVLLLCCWLVHAGPDELYNLVFSFKDYLPTDCVEAALAAGNFSARALWCF
jgi:hypothetical protein